MTLFALSDKEEQPILFSERILRIASPLLITLCLWGAAACAGEEAPEPRGEIRVVESWRPDINVLQYLAPRYVASAGWDEFLKQREIRTGKEEVAA